MSNTDRKGAGQYPAPAAARPQAPGDFDLERALWDLDYRRQVLEAIRRARQSPQSAES